MEVIHAWEALHNLSEALPKRCRRYIRAVEPVTQRCSHSRKRICTVVRWLGASGESFLPLFFVPPTIGNRLGVWIGVGTLVGIGINGLATVQRVVHCGEDLIDGHRAVAVRVARQAPTCVAVAKRDVYHGEQLVDCHGTISVAVANARAGSR